MKNLLKIPFVKTIIFGFTWLISLLLFLKITVSIVELGLLLITFLILLIFSILIGLSLKLIKNNWFMLITLVLVFSELIVLLL